MGQGLTPRGAPARYAGGLQEIGPRVWAWLAPNGSWGEANAGLVVGDGASLLVDTLWDELLAGEMLAAMAPLLDGAPVGAVVNTHADGDHWWGNAVVPPEAEIITGERSRRAMDHEVPAELARIARLTGRAGRLPGRAGEFARYMHDMLGPFAFAGVRRRLPDRTFAGETTIEVGGRAARLIEVGPAHTVGDLVVHVRDAGVVFAADVLWGGSTPVMWAGPVDHWLAALDTLLSLDAAVYVPGHGPAGGREQIERVREYWRWLDAEVRERHALGRTPLAAAREIAGLPGLRPWLGWECPERIVINVATMYRNLDDEPVLTSPVARARLFWGVAGLAGELRARS